MRFNWMGLCCIGSLFLVAAATTCHYYSKSYRSITDTLAQQPQSIVSKKQQRKAAKRANRRERKDAQLRIKKQERTIERKMQLENMTEEQKREQMERIKLQRVEQYQKLEHGMANGVHVVVDLGFVTAQTSRECNSILKQLGCVYGYMKKCPLDALMSLRVVSCHGPIAALCEQHGIHQWKIICHEQSLEQVYDHKKIIYLSPDSDNVLDSVDQDHVYVVGGIVDRSVRKGETLSKARQHQFRTARLPVQEYLPATRTHILNIDSVLIALNEYFNHRSWPRAFEEAIPKRITQRKNKKTTE